MKKFLGKVVAKVEQLSESVNRTVQLHLPFVARFCLLSHFIQDNVIVGHYYKSIMRHASHDLLGAVVAGVFVLCFIARIVGFFLALFNKKLRLACGLLFGSGILQIISVVRFPDISNILVNASVFGSLFFLLTESQKEPSSSHAGLPTLGTRKTQDYIKFFGRCLLMCMFINFIALEPSLLLILQDIIGLSLMILVVIGFKINISVPVTILYLNIFNFYENDWWNIVDEPHERLVVEHRFLEGISVTGGLLMLVLQGPGEISIDKDKKMW